MQKLDYWWKLFWKYFNRVAPLQLNMLKVETEIKKHFLVFKAFIITPLEPQQLSWRNGRSSWRPRGFHLSLKISDKQWHIVMLCYISLFLGCWIIDDSLVGQLTRQTRQGTKGHSPTHDDGEQAVDVEDVLDEHILQHLQVRGLARLRHNHHEWSFIMLQGGCLSCLHNQSNHFPLFKFPLATSSTL